MFYFAQHIAVMTFITAGMLAGQQILLFDAGLLCLSTAASFAIGGYISAILSVSLDMSSGFAMIGGVVASGLMALIIGIILIPLLRQDFFALATLAITQATAVFLKTAGPGRAAGFAGIPPINTPLAFILPESIDSLILAATFFTVSAIVIIWIRRSRFGILVNASCADENAVSVLGYRPYLIRVQVFVIASSMAGAAGAFQAHYLGVVEPAMSSIPMTILLLCGTVLSGRRHVLGTIIGALFLVGVPSILQTFFSRFADMPAYAFTVVQIVFGVLIIVVVMFVFPRSQASGVMPKKRLK